MHKYVVELTDYWQYKVAAGLFTLIFSDDFFQLILCFCLIECLDIFTRMLAQSKACWVALYPQTKVGVWRYFTFMWQARKWRFIKSDGLRQGADKILTYLLLLLTSALVDTAFSIGHVKVFTLTTLVVGFLGMTESLSILENISEISSINVITKIKDKVKDKLSNI